LTTEHAATKSHEAPSAPKTPETPAVTKFSELPLMDSLQQAVTAAGYETPTPIQARCILPALEGRDLIGLAQTGTGKTAAFALPIIQRLARVEKLGALVLAPTRELVQQIVGVFRELGKTSGIRVIGLVGGIKMEKDWNALRSWPNVIVATPGRLLDHMEQKTVAMKEVEILVVDEADRMHDMGFIPQIRRVIAALPTERQTMMFTATMPPDVEQIARRSMRDPLKIQVGLASRPVERAEQKLYDIHETQKVPMLLDILRKETGRVLVFVRTKRGVDRLARRMRDLRHPVARLHGDREQAQRDEAMGGFREGKYRILIATDIAARGLDVDDIEHVINYDFPRSPEDYIHRIGRTARVAASGKATSFVMAADRAMVRALEKLIGSKITLTPAPGMRPVEGNGDGDGHADRHSRSSRSGEGSHGHGGRRPHGGGAGQHGGHARAGGHGGHRSAASQEKAPAHGHEGGGHAAAGRGHGGSHTHAAHPLGSGHAHASTHGHEGGGHHPSKASGSGDAAWQAAGAGTQGAEAGSRSARRRRRRRNRNTSGGAAPGTHTPHA
jgi:ATP-dependent RNA helicase RhlE